MASSRSRSKSSAQLRGCAPVSEGCRKHRRTGFRCRAIDDCYGMETGDCGRRHGRWRLVRTRGGPGSAGWHSHCCCLPVSSLFRQRTGDFRPAGRLHDGYDGQAAAIGEANEGCFERLCAMGSVKPESLTVTHMTSATCPYRV